MIEKIIFLEGIDPLDLYGVKNGSLELIRRHFPKLKITARGHEIKAAGDKQSVTLFEEKIQQIIEYFQKFNH